MTQIQALGHVRHYAGSVERGLYLMILDSSIHSMLDRTQRVTPPQPRSKLQDVVNSRAMKISASTCTWASTAELDGDTPSVSADNIPPVSKQSAAVFSGLCEICCLLKWMMVSVKMANVAVK
jgi:hypothetical protein